VSFERLLWLKIFIAKNFTSPGISLKTKLFLFSLVSCYLQSIFVRHRIMQLIWLYDTLNSIFVNNRHKWVKLRSWVLTYSKVNSSFQNMLLRSLTSRVRHTFTLLREITQYGWDKCFGGKLRHSITSTDKVRNSFSTVERFWIRVIWVFTQCSFKMLIHDCKKTKQLYQVYLMTCF